VVDIANERQARELVPLLRAEGEAAAVEVVSELRAKYGDSLTAQKIRDAVADRIGRENLLKDLARKVDEGEWIGLEEDERAEQPATLTILFETPEELIQLMRERVPELELPQLPRTVSRKWPPSGGHS
jgi:hypothetical protein